MGMFDTVAATLECPVRKESKERQILVKWKDDRRFDVFRQGDTIDEISPEYNNAWIRSDYVCESCSHLTHGRHGNFVKTDDQIRHYCYIRTENGVVAEVLSGDDFFKLGIEGYVLDD